MSTTDTDIYQDVGGDNAPDRLSGFYTKNEEDLYSFAATIPNYSASFTFSLKDYGYDGPTYLINFVNVDNGTAWGSESLRTTGMYKKGNTNLPFAVPASAYIPIPKLNDTADDSSPTPFKQKTLYANASVYIFAKQKMSIGGIIGDSVSWSALDGCYYTSSDYMIDSDVSPVTYDSSAHGVWIYAQAGGGGGSGYSNTLSSCGRGGGGGGAALVYLDCHGLAGAHAAIQSTSSSTSSGSLSILTNIYPCFRIDVGSGGSGGAANNNGGDGEPVEIYSCIPSKNTLGISWDEHLLVSISGGSGGSITSSSGGLGGTSTIKYSSESDSKFVYIPCGVSGGQGGAAGKSGSSISTSSDVIPCSGDIFYPYRKQNSMQYGAGISSSTGGGGGGSSCGSPSAGAYYYGMGGTGGGSSGSSGAAGKLGVVAILEPLKPTSGRFNIIPPACTNTRISSGTVYKTIANNNPYTTTLYAYGTTNLSGATGIGDLLYSKSVPAGGTVKVSYTAAKYSGIVCKFSASIYIGYAVSNYDSALV